MEIESLFAEPRWSILELITNRPSSPLEISEKLNLTPSYVSQQLRLLEMAKLIKKVKVSQRDKGKPRSIYSISEGVSYLILLTEKFPRKKLLKLTEHHKIILKIWVGVEPEFHYDIEKLYWKLQNKLEEKEAIIIENNTNIPKIHIVYFKQPIKTETEKLRKEFPKLNLVFNSKLNSFDFSNENFILIYQNSSSIEKLRKLKGGTK